MTFYGNPNVAITAIDISGGIACSRTGGQTPCFVQVSGSAITATGTSNPYRDLEFSWNFGDPSGTEVFTDHYTGASVNANSAKIAPEAEYGYRSPGTYMITLTIRGKNGSGFTTATVTQAITVTAYNASGGDWYFSWGAAGGDGSIGLPFGTVAQFNTKAAIANAALHINRGTTSLGSSGLVIGAGPLRIDAYGSGADPAVNINTGTNPAWLLSVGGSSVTTRNDIVTSGLDLIRSGDTNADIATIIISDANCTCKDVYFDNCDFLSALTTPRTLLFTSIENTSLVASKFSNMGFWNCSFVAQSGDQSRGSSFFGGPVEWGFFVGGTHSGTGGNDTLHHHIYPDIQNHASFSYINFGDGPHRNYCINGNWDDTVNPSSLVLANYWCISNCNISGTFRAFDAGNGTNDPTLTQFPTYVAQQCAFNNLTADGPIGAVCATGLTLRDANIWNCDERRFLAVSGPVDSSNHVYRIKQYRVTGSHAQDSSFDWSLRTWTVPQTFTDNIIFDAQSDARIVRLDSFANHQAIGSIIDRNQYWFPNDTDSKVWYDSTTAKTFAQWQAFVFDVNGSVANPYFLDPANGDFTQYRRRVRLTATA